LYDFTLRLGAGRLQALIAHGRAAADIPGS
jgi:hypothetical protein